jgi:hypothetical protein
MPALHYVAFPAVLTTTLVGIILFAYMMRYLKQAHAAVWTDLGQPKVLSFLRVVSWSFFTYQEHVSHIGVHFHQQTQRTQ